MAISHRLLMHAGKSSKSDPDSGNASASDPAKTEAGPSTAAGGPDTAADPATAGDKAATADESAGLPIQLSALRRADVSDFRGAHYVNIREFYEVGHCSSTCCFFVIAF